MQYYYTHTTEEETTLTEFEVTETYVVKARTIQEAEDMVSDNDFGEHGITNHKSTINPNF